jgi:hypothetical protein
MRTGLNLRRMMRCVSVMVAALLVCASLCGCLVVGYSSGSGWWVWPGSLAITLVLMLVWLINRR